MRQDVADLAVDVVALETWILCSLVRGFFLSGIGGVGGVGRFPPTLVVGDGGDRRGRLSIGGGARRMVGGLIKHVVAEVLI